MATTNTPTTPTPDVLANVAILRKSSSIRKVRVESLGQEIHYVPPSIRVMMLFARAKQEGDKDNSLETLDAVAEAVSRLVVDANGSPVWSKDDTLDLDSSLALEILNCILTDNNADSTTNPTAEGNASKTTPG